MIHLFLSNLASGRRVLPFLTGVAALVAPLHAQKLPWSYLPPVFDTYLDQRVKAISGAEWLGEITKENWPERQSEMRHQLRQMLGFDPLPERTPLNPVVTGHVQGDGYAVEKLYFEALPGLYIGANLYLPEEKTQPLPTVLYVSGHAMMKDGEVLFGNKTGYQHHGSWFARHGYVCLILDTIELGEIPGAHRGTGRLERWWWPSRGYTPAGVEAWVGIRALDYLETRSEVDATRIGMTGRSGGGIYTWWVGALDDRVKAAVPVAGMTTLHDHIVVGAIEGHCDCMYMVNTEGWDFDRVAALMAPRPLLISNTDSDEIYPIEGVMEIFYRTRRLYRELGQERNLAIHIAEGPHKDTQPLNVGAFNWLNRFLKGADRTALFDEAARVRHEPAELKVFSSIPEDETITTVDEFFVPAFAPVPVPNSAPAWEKQRGEWMRALQEEVFHAWPAPGLPEIVEKQEEAANGLKVSKVVMKTQDPFDLPLWILHREEVEPEQLELSLHVLGESEWESFHSWAEAGFPESADASGGSAFSDMIGPIEGTRAVAFFCPRGVCGRRSENRIEWAV